jgi:N-acetylmuramoyl-L-alanine amidase
MAKVFLSAGHGGSDPGAVANGLYEKTINLNTLLACQAELVRHGVTVVCSRTTDADDPVGQEVKEANASGADVAVSFHANAGGGDGFEAFYHTTNSKGKKLAELCEKYVKTLGQNSRGLKSGDHLYFLKHTTMTSVLVESFFVDNLKDKTIGDTTEEQKEFGIAYAKAILEYLGISYKATSISTTSKTLYKVQVGAYSDKSNAEAMVKSLKNKGFEAIIVKA